MDRTSDKAEQEVYLNSPPETTCFSGLSSLSDAQMTSRKFGTSENGIIPERVNAPPMRASLILLGRSRCCKSGIYFPQRLVVPHFCSVWSTFCGGCASDLAKRFVVSAWSWHFLKKIFVLCAIVEIVEVMERAREQVKKNGREWRGARTC